MNMSSDQSYLSSSQSPSNIIYMTRRFPSIDVECIGLIQTSFSVWYDVNIHDFNNDLHESLHDMNDLIDIYLNEMEEKNISIDEVLLSSYREVMLSVFYDTCMNVHGLSVYQLVRDGIRDNLHKISPYHPFSTQLNIVVPQAYRTYGGHSRHIDVLLLNGSPCDAAQNPLLRSLCRRRSLNDQYYVFYHGCTEQACHSICLNGIGLHWSNSKGTDFGPGFYLANNIRDAMDVAVRRVRCQQINQIKGEQKSRPCCIVFHCPKKEYDDFSTLDLSIIGFDQSVNRSPIKSQEISETDILTWHNFVHLCHDNRYPLPLVKSYDRIQGPVCTNVRELQAGNQYPKFRLNSFQLCVRSVPLAEKFIEWIKSVIILENQSCSTN